MELLQLRYFVRAAELESMTKAAASLNVSQPTVSSGIIRLEEELGVKLFDRIGKRIALNENGRLLLKEARRSLNGLDAASAALSSTSGECRGTVSLGVLTSIESITSHICAFAEINPHVTFDINCRANADMVRSFLFDVSLFPDTDEFEGIPGIPINRNVFGVVMSMEHRLSSCKMLYLRDLSDEDFILANRNSKDDRQLLEACSHAGFAPRIRAICAAGVVRHQLVERNQGVSFIRDTTEQAHQIGKNARFIPILDEELQCNTLLGCRPEAYMTEVGKTFRDFMFSRFHIPANKQTLQIFEQ